MTGHVSLMTLTENAPWLMKQSGSHSPKAARWLSPITGKVGKPGTAASRRMRQPKAEKDGCEAELVNAASHACRTSSGHPCGCMRTSSPA